MLKNHLKKLCTTFCEDIFTNKVNRKLNDAHMKFAINDGFLVLSQKHEFISIYDFDEFVFPRTMNFDKLLDYSCNNSKDSICNLNPFVNNYKSSRIDGPARDSFYYNYLQSLIDKYGRGRNLEKFNSFEIQHAATMNREAEMDFIKNMGLLLNELDANKTRIRKFPYTLQVHLSHNFLIENNNDVNYARELFKVYNNFALCAYEKELKTKNIDLRLVRALYYLTEERERAPKSIYYYKNIRAIRLHRAESYALHGWSIYPPGKDGHFLPHCRNELKIKNKIVNESISNLKVDYEYLFFFLKNFTYFCNK